MSTEVKNALISVSDKSHLDMLVLGLSRYHVGILSSGGTAKKIRELGYENVMDVSDYTGFLESPDGLVKTLQGKLYAGILMNPNNEKHKEYMEKVGARHIDVVAVNLYPFKQTVAKPNVTPQEAFENIDIGGPCMIRAAAKAAMLHKTVAVVVDPTDYGLVVGEMTTHDGCISETTITQLAHKAFNHTAEYETAIAEYLRKVM